MRKGEPVGAIGYERMFRVGFINTLIDSLYPVKVSCLT